MHLIRHIAVAATLLAAMPALADATVTSVKVREGYFVANDCTPEAAPKEINECVCQADITKAQVSGISTAAATAINNQLSQLPETFSTESCTGKPTRAPEANIQFNKTTANYTTVYQTPKILTVLVNYTTFGAGAAHPMSGSEGYTLDLATGKTISPSELLTAEQLKAANEVIRSELSKKYGQVMLDEAKDRIDPYLTDAGCEDCTLYYDKDGWKMRFQLYVIAPYSSGEPEITLPTTVIPDPETLLTAKKK